MSHQKPMSDFGDFTSVPFATRWEKLVGDVSVKEAVERLNGVMLGKKERLINGLIFCHTDFSDSWDRYGEVINCLQLVDGAPPDKKGGSGRELRWTIGLQYHLHKSPKDRTVTWTYESKDHNAGGDAVFSTSRSAADVGLTHTFKKLRVSEEQAAADLRDLMEAPIPPKPTPEERLARLNESMRVLTESQLGWSSNQS